MAELINGLAMQLHAPLQNGHYLEVVCPLDHTSSYSTNFGKAVSKSAAEGGGWLT